MEAIMMEIIKMISHMEKEYINGQIQKFIMVIGNMEFSKDMGKKFQKEQLIKVIGKMAFLMGLELVNLLIKVNMKATGKMDNLMVKVLKQTQMAQFMLEIGF